MTQQRFSLLLAPLLLAVVSCGGGPGASAEVADPDAPPKISDQQPPISNQNPASAAAKPPDNSQPPNGTGTTPVTPPTGGGGDCVSLCNTLPEHGCQLPEEGCTAGCADLLAETCGREVLALERCALAVACPENLDDPATQQLVMTSCPRQYQDYVDCVTQ